MRSCSAPEFVAHRQLCPGLDEFTRKRREWEGRSQPGRSCPTRARVGRAELAGTENDLGVEALLALEDPDSGEVINFVSKSPRKTASATWSTPTSTTPIVGGR